MHFASVETHSQCFKTHWKCSSTHLQCVENALQRKNASTLFSLSLLFPNRVTIVLSQYEEGLNTKIDKNFLSLPSKNKGLGKIPSYDPYNALFCKEINIGATYNDTADIRPRN